MVSRFSVRLSTSLAAALLAALGTTQAFGRFGYGAMWNVPGLVLEKGSFRVDQAAADRFYFPTEFKQWRPLQTSDTTQTVFVGDYAGAPSKLRQDLLAPGVSMFFSQGIRLRLTTTTAPLLTWPEGSLDANTEYATPPAQWVVVSFRDRQPPVMLGFLSPPPGVKLNGKAGEWWLTTDPSWSGWVRVSAPLGSRAFATLGASDLGKLSQAIQPMIAAATQPAPVVTGFKVVEDGMTLSAEWTFDRPNAVVPFPAFLSAIGGYQLQLASKTVNPQVPTSQGPILLTAEPKLTLRGVARRVPTGRSLALGPATEAPLSTASFLDPPSVTELALTNLMGHTEKVVRDLAEQTVGEFLTEGTYTLEPGTQQKLPYDAAGNGLDLSAAHALLFQSTLSTVRATSDPNSLLTSVIWRRDWLTWRLWCEDDTKRRRAMALAALAAAISPEPERRWEGVMFQAGLAAERGLMIWRRRADPAVPATKHLEPMFGLREDLFGKEDYRRKAGFGALLASDLRVYGDIGVQLTQNGAERRLRFTASDTRPVTFSMASSFPIEVIAGKGVVSVQATQAFGVTVIRAVPRDAGPCELEINWPDWAPKLPAWSAPPRFVEDQR